MTITDGKLRVAGIKKRVADFTLSADFEVERGERAALLGQSGSGKTTLLRWIAGLDFLESLGSGDSIAGAGRVWLDGRDITDLPPRERGIGVMFQDYALFPALNVMENVCFGLKVRGVPRAVREAKAIPWLERVGLQSRMRSSVSPLSGGERQRVAFVRAVIWEPKLLLLDEPFSALDPSLRGVMRKELVELHRLYPVPLLMVTHDQADLDAVATLRFSLIEESPGNRLVKKSSF